MKQIEKIIKYCKATNSCKGCKYYVFNHEHGEKYCFFGDSLPLWDIELLKALKKREID